MENADEVSKAAQSGNPVALRYALDALKEFEDWDWLMHETVHTGSLDCVKVLYDKGYEQHRSPQPFLHPGVLAVNYGQLEILLFVVEASGPPQVEELDGEDAVLGGVDMLKYVRELGCVFDHYTTQTAARRGDLEALKYLRANGAPWNSRTLAEAVYGSSLPCLEYAHMHGCPQDGLQEYWRFRDARTRSLPVLRYVCEHFDPALGARVLEDTAEDLSRQVKLLRRKSKQWENSVDWPFVLYLERKLGAAVPKSLAEARATWRKRAATLAGVFWTAGQRLCAEETRLRQMGAAGGETTQAYAERLALLNTMGRVPRELQELIALKAGLIGI
jgi:hypothetical protein